MILHYLPRLLLAACILFFCAAYFTTRFPDTPGAWVGSYLSTFLIALPSFIALTRFLGPKKATIALLALTALGFAVETTGVATGFPYGPFYYGDSLGPKVAGLVPYLLPVSWVPLVLGAVAATFPIGEKTGQKTLALLPRVLSATVLLTLIDGVLDPGAASLGFWVWPEGGAYYGVPITNFLGWLLSSALASTLLILLARDRWGGPPPPGLLDSALVALAFWTGVAVFSGLVLPAALGVALCLVLIHRRRNLAARYSGRKMTTEGGPRAVGDGRIA